MNSKGEAFKKDFASVLTDGYHTGGAEASSYFEPRSYRRHSWAFILERQVLMVIILRMILLEVMLFVPRDYLAS